MKIEVFQQDEGLDGGREVWVRVLSDEVVDWKDVKSAMTIYQYGALDGTSMMPSSYYPHLVTAEEKAEHGFSLEDWFVLKVKKAGLR